MADVDPGASGTYQTNSERPAVNSASQRAGSADGNHAQSNAVPGSGPSPQQNSASDEQSGVERAEAVIDSLAEKLSTVTSSWGRKLLRLGSRARESAQDFWAEVQDFRRGEKP
jgi:hypothetical protein